MTAATDATGEIERVPTGMPGMDLICHGGVPKDRLTLVSGTAGSGKTVFVGEFLANGVTDHDEPGVFVTFEERPSSIRRNLRSFGWPIEEWEEQGKWTFVDATARYDVHTSFSGDDFDLSPLIARVMDAVRRIGARRIALDSVGALLAQFDDIGPARHALFLLATALEEAGVTSVMTAERDEEYGRIAQYGFEEFVADNVVILRNALDGERRRRTVEVLKMRGGSHVRGEHLFTLLAGEGIIVVPVAVVGLNVGTSTARLPSGNPELDEMCGGGVFERSLVLVAGATGTGKSLLTTQFIAAGIRNGERALLHSFEESRDQVVRNASAWGIDFDTMEAEGRLRIMATAPEAATLEDHLQRMKAVVDEFQPDRVAIDSLTALQRVSTVKGFREYVLGLTYQIKSNARLGLVTTTSKDFLRGEPTNDLHVSTISDTIFLLHYVPLDGQLLRGINVLKMRGSDHDKSVREFRITGVGMEIGEPFADITELF